MGVYKDAEQALHCQGFPETTSSLLNLTREALPCICDTKTLACGNTYYRVRADKALCWLRCKVGRTAAALRLLGGSFASIGDEALQLYSAGILADYLDAKWGRLLMATYSSVPDQVVGPAQVTPPPASSEIVTRKRPLVCFACSSVL